MEYFEICVGGWMMEHLESCACGWMIEDGAL